MRFGELYRGETTIDFFGMRNRWFTVSGVLLAVSLLALIVLRLDTSVDFTGGTIVSAPNTAEASVADIRSALSEIGEDGARVQLIGEQLDINVQTEALDPAEQDELVAVVAAVAGVTVDETNVDAVGPTFGAEITRRAIQALVIFLIVVAAFISWRFEWKMAVAGLAALFHDLLITAGIYSIVRFEVTPATVIALLTILGYSLYDTVVVFDKITESVRDLGSKHTFIEISNFSMNQVLMRSINTSLTTLLPIGSLLFIGSYLLGATTLREFALALFIGVAAGTYSSIFVATPLLTMWKEQEPEWQRMQRRIARRGEGGELAEGFVPTIDSVATGAVARAPRQRRKRR